MGHVKKIQIFSDLQKIKISLIKRTVKSQGGSAIGPPLSSWARIPPLGGLLQTDHEYCSTRSIGPDELPLAPTNFLEPLLISLSFPPISFLFVKFTSH